MVRRLLILIVSIHVIHKDNIVKSQRMIALDKVIRV